MPTHVYNQGWFAENENRTYPISSLVTLIDNNGRKLPENIFCDLNLTYPESFGTLCFISGVQITDNLITFVISSKLNATTHTLAYFSAKQPITNFKQYDLDSSEKGVYGTVVFGSGVSTERGIWVFNDNTQSAIDSSCFNTYSAFAVSSIGVLSTKSELQGEVTLESGYDIKLELKQASISGTTINAIFIGLDIESDVETVLSKYLSTCDTRTESDTCSRTSVSMLGAATPNCAGAISIIGDGITVSSSGNILLMSTEKTLEDVCGSTEEAYHGVSKCDCFTDSDDESQEGSGSGTGSGTGSSSGSSSGSGTALVSEPQYLYPSVSDYITIISGGMDIYGTRVFSNDTDLGPLTFTIDIDRPYSVYFNVTLAGTITIKPEGDSVGVTVENNIMGTTSLTVYEDHISKFQSAEESTIYTGTDLLNRLTVTVDKVKVFIQYSERITD